MKKTKIMAIALTMVAGFAISAVAADWSFYGSARISTFVTDTDNPGATADTKTLGESLQGNSRIGARVKVSDELTGRFEYGAADGVANIRHLYGEWDFGAGKLLVGQTDTPITMFYSNQVYGGDEDLLSYGGVNGKRKAQLRLTFGNFKIAAIAPSNLDSLFEQAIEDGNLPPSFKYANEVKLPKIEASYKLDLDNAFVELGAGYQTFELSIENGANKNSYDIDSYIIAMGAGMTFGQFYVNGDIFFGQNMGAYGNSTADGVNCTPDIRFSSTQVVDNDSYGFMIAAGAKINDIFSVEAGYGYVEAELDMAGSSEDAAASYYLQTTVTLAPGVFFVPEIGVIDNKKGPDRNSPTFVDQPEILYYGVKWQINF